MAHGVDKDESVLALPFCYQPYALRSFLLTRDEQRFTNDEVRGWQNTIAALMTHVDFPLMTMPVRYQKSRLPMAI